MEDITGRTPFPVRRRGHPTSVPSKNPWMANATIPVIPTAVSIGGALLGVSVVGVVTVPTLVRVVAPELVVVVD